MLVDREERVSKTNRHVLSKVPASRHRESFVPHLSLLMGKGQWSAGGRCTFQI